MCRNELHDCPCVLRQAQDEEQRARLHMRATKKSPHPELVEGRTVALQPRGEADPMTDAIKFTLDGAEVEAAPGETIWQVANRRGIEIPHLCYSPAPGYRPDGNCRACMVEIEGERVLAASCIRKPTAGMKVKTASERAKFSRRMVFELLVSDQPKRAESHDPDSRFWRWADRVGVDASRFPERHQPK